MAGDVPDPSAETGQPSRGGGVLGLLRRLGGAGRGSAAVSFSMVEELFGPTRHRARIEIEAQRSQAEPSPAPTDPPERPDQDPPAAGRFRGRLVLRRR